MGTSVQLIDRGKARKLLEEELHANMVKLNFAYKKPFFYKKINEETDLRVSHQILKDKKSKLGLFTRVGFINWKVAGFIHSNLEAPDALPANMVATLSGSLGYFMPNQNRLEWYFDCNEESIYCAARIAAEDVITYGMPFMMRYPDLPKLLLWAENPQIEPNASYLQPPLLRAVIFYLTGNWSKAKEIITSELEGCDVKDPGNGPMLRLKSLLDDSREYSLHRLQ